MRFPLLIEQKQEVSVSTWFSKHKNVKPEKFEFAEQPGGVSKCSSRNQFN